MASSTTQTDMLIIDFSKAFDKVPHKRLNYKLNWYGIRRDTLEWITEFLSSRSQRVVLDGATSDSAPVLSGCPQWTTLFLIYINDLPDGVVNLVQPAYSLMTVPVNMHVLGQYWLLKGHYWQYWQRYTL